MTRIYLIKIDRSDRPKPDTIYLRASDRAEAVRYVRAMYGQRLLKVYPQRLKVDNSPR